MSKKIVAMLMALVIACAGPAMALDLQAGTKVDVTIDKKVDIEGASVQANYSAVNYNVYTDIDVADWIVITPTAGLFTSALDIDTFYPFNGTTGVDIDLDSGVGFNVGVDAKAVVVKTDYADLALIAGYRFSRVDVDAIDVTIDGMPGIEINNPIEAILYTHKYELGVIAEKDLSTIPGLRDVITVPLNIYGGVVYSDLVGNIDVNSPIGTLEQNISAADNIGIRCGLFTEPIKDLTLGIDLKFVDETAVGVSVAYRF